MSAGHRSKLEVSFLLVEHGARIFENNIHGLRPVDLEPVRFSPLTVPPLLIQNMSEFLKCKKTIFTVCL